MNVILNSIDGLDGVNAHNQNIINTYKLKNSNSQSLKTKNAKRQLQLLEQNRENQYQSE